MKCQILFSGKKKKYISVYCLLKTLPRVLSVNFGAAQNYKYVFGPWSSFRPEKKHNYTQNSRKNIIQNSGFNDNLKPGQVTEKWKGRQ